MTNDSTKIVQKLGVPDDIARLAIDIFGSSGKAKIWLNTPIHIIGGSKPIDMLNTDADIEKIRVILRNIECGEFQ